jgi:quercetin dioxygenase-like cupin family protein
MKSLQRVVLSAIVLATATAAFPLAAQDSPQRKELKRADLSGAPGMEVVLSISEYKPGDAVGLHFHHGVEAAYIVEGGMIQPAGKDPTELKTGAPIMNLRDVPHAGWKVVGNKTIKILTVHVVDKGKPLYDWVKN